METAKRYSERFQQCLFVARENPQQIATESKNYGLLMKHSERQMIARPHPLYGWDFPEKIPEKFRKDPGNALRVFPGIPLQSMAGIPQAL